MDIQTKLYPKGDKNIWWENGNGSGSNELQTLKSMWSIEVWLWKKTIKLLEFPKRLNSEDRSNKEVKIVGHNGNCCNVKKIILKVD